MTRVTLVVAVRPSEDGGVGIDVRVCSDQRLRVNPGQLIVSVWSEEQSILRIRVAHGASGRVAYLHANRALIDVLNTLSVGVSEQPVQGNA